MSLKNLNYPLNKANLLHRDCGGVFWSDFINSAGNINNPKKKKLPQLSFNFDSNGDNK